MARILINKKRKVGCGRKRILSISQMEEILNLNLPVKELAARYNVGLTVMYQAIRDRNSPYANFIDRDETAA